MRKSLLSILVGLLFCVFLVQAQTSKISELAGQIEQNISDLADRSSQDFFSRSVNNRSEIENLLAVRQLKATAETFLLLVNNNRSGAELREAANSLNDLSRKYSPNSVTNAQYQQIKRDIEDLLTELKDNNNSQNTEKDKKPGVIGKLHWQGTIDDDVHLIISGGAVQVKTVSGTEYSDGIFSFTSPLPDENVKVFVNKKEGRGSVKIIQQPTDGNNFTAIIQVLDKSGGAKEYDLEIYWTK